MRRALEALVPYLTAERAAAGAAPEPDAAETDAAETGAAETAAAETGAAETGAAETGAAETDAAETAAAQTDSAETDAAEPAAVARGEHLRDRAPAAGLVDTVLLKALLHVDVDEAERFLRSPNACWVPECEALLRAAARWRALVELYRGRAMHRRALSLLAQLGQAEAIGSPQRRARMEEMVAYMQRLGAADASLILEFSRWVLAEAPALGLRAFTRRAPEADHNEPLDPYRVLSHLKACSLASHKESPRPLWQQHALAVDYLEHLVHERRPPSTDPAFHNELVYLYVEAILALAAERDADGGKTPGSRAQNARARPTLASEEEGPLREYRGRLLRFLEHSQHYNPEKILSKFPSSRLLEERAVLLSRVGKHDRALHIYVHKLRAKGLAEAYCEKFWAREKGPRNGPTNAGATGDAGAAGAAEAQADAAEAYPAAADASQARGGDVYLSLLRAYLRRPPGARARRALDRGDSATGKSASQIRDAVELLERHHARIDPVRALELLPKTATVKALEPYLRATLRSNASRHRRNQVVGSLLKLENLQVRRALLREQNRAVRIEPSQPCPVCGRRIGDRIFARYPNGVVVHFACSKDRFECPVTGERFDERTAA
jgi:hypothetical protein